MIIELNQGDSTAQQCSEICHAGCDESVSVMDHWDDKRNIHVVVPEDTSTCMKSYRKSVNI